METEPLNFDHSSLISVGLENVRLSVFHQYLLFFDQNLLYLSVFFVLIYDVTSSGLSWQLD